MKTMNSTDIQRELQAIVDLERETRVRIYTKLPEGRDDEGEYSAWWVGGQRGMELPVLAKMFYGKAVKIAVD